MKTNNKDFVFSWFNTLLIAVIIGFFAVMAAKAESNLDLNVLDGLFTPTQSERFFQAGREDFEREVEIFNHPEQYLRDDLLHIDPELIEQMNQGQFYLDFDLENSSDEMN